MSDGQHGEKLRKRRKERGVTLQELAKQTRCTHQLVSNVERGVNTTIDRLDDLAAALGLRAYITVYDPNAERVATVRPEESELLDSIARLPARRRMLVERLAGVADRVSDDTIGMLLAMVMAAEQQNRARPDAPAALDSSSHRK